MIQPRNDGLTLPEGLYELLNTRDLQQSLAGHIGLKAVLEPVPDSWSSEALSTHIAGKVREALDQTDPQDRVALANSLLHQLGADGLEPGPQQLTSLFAEEGLELLR